MLSLPEDLNKAQDGTLLRTKVSERSIGLSVFSEDDKKALVPSTTRKPWKPVTQKAYFLVPTILASAALVAVLQVYLMRSERYSGILFASKINDLPLGQRFPYLYLPTIVSLVLSFAWTWIDLDVKRLQPYVQLSRPQGALGSDSVLLHYPFDFVAFVPFAAGRRRHWPVVSASLAVVIIFWGLTPLQSSIFAIQTIEQVAQVTSLSSTTYLSLKEQKTTLTGSYAQSVYNIAWLNESLPPFMSRQGMLAPYTLTKNDSKAELLETWTAPTRFYSVDISCEEPFYYADAIYSSDGCRYDLGNMNLPSDMNETQFNTLYVGYWYEESMDSYLLGDCPVSANQTFLVRWSHGRKNLTDSSNSPFPIEGTTLWCRPFYYQQEVNATVNALDMSVLDIVPLGPKRSLPADLINITDFEWSMSQGYEKNKNRGEFPTSSWPEPYERIQSTFPELYWDMYLPYMASFALASYQRPEADYLNAETLKNSYQAAYRLLLARKLADILSSDFKNSERALGVRRYSTQAVIMVPSFVYVVESLLGITLIVALLLLTLPSWRRTNLISEPASLASMMALSGHDSRLVRAMRDKDTATSHDLKETHEGATFILSKENTSGATICCIDCPPQPHRNKSSKPILPIELSWPFGAGFLVLQGSILAALLYPYFRAQLENGLPFPSNLLLVNQILVKYLPMVVSAFFEPIFTWLTRTLCMLQPYEQLRKGNAIPSRSVTMDYNSLPPQAMIARALRHGHLSLASICCLMTLLANVLSLAFSSLLYERVTMISTPQNFTAQYRIPIDGQNIPNTTFDHFYIAMSNFTAGTPLPAWTDERFFYIPFEQLGTYNSSTALYQAKTPAVSASLQCFPMQQQRRDGNLTWEVLVGNPNCNLNLLPTYPNDHTRQSEAIEYTSFSNNASSCDLTVQFGWGRTSRQATKDPLNASWIGCEPKVQIELREVTVNSQGLVQSSKPTSEALSDQEQLSGPDSACLMKSIQTLLDYSNTPEYPYTRSNPYHNDSYPSDFFNYLMVQTQNSSAFLDPALPPPSFNATVPVLEAVYARVFAIILGTHIPDILQPIQGTIVVAGFTLTSNNRIFVSSPMFIVSVVILGIYMLITMILYTRRPWKILPRMPTTIASQIGFFAASHTLQGFASTSSMSEKERNSYINGLRQRYGFGRYIGTDGRTHIGIEREPLVQTLTKGDLRSMHQETAKE